MHKTIIQASLKSPNRRIARLIRELTIAAILMAYLGSSSAAELKTSLGLNYFQGEYDQDRTTKIMHSAFDARYRNFPWEVRLTLPWLKIDGYGGIDGNGNIIGDGSGEHRVDTGIGDIPLKVSYYYMPNTEQPLLKSSFFKFSGQIKFPSADENKGLGTGEFDYTLETQWIKPMEHYTPFTTLGYTYVGKTSESILVNRWFYKVGTVYQWQKNFQSGIMYTYKQPSSKPRQSDQKLIGFFNWRLPESQWGIEGYTLAGLTNAAPDYAVGVSFSYYYDW